MAYSRISHGHSYYTSLSYILEGKGHDGSEHRNLLVVPVGLKDETVESYYSQFGKLMLRKKNVRNINETRTAIVSFSEEELDPDAPESPYIAAQIAIDICRRGFDGFPCVIAIQNDNDGHKIHIHMVFANVHCETGFGFARKQTQYQHLRYLTDEACSQYINNDTRSKTHERKSQRYRGLLESNEAIRKENEALQPEEQKPLKYVWREDLKERVLASMQGVKSYKEFQDNLEKNGIGLEILDSRKYGLGFRYILKDTSKFTGKIPTNLHVRSYRLDNEYGFDALEEEIARNNKGAPSADNPEPSLSRPLRPKAEVPVVLSAQDREDIGSIIRAIYKDAVEAELPKPRRRSRKTRGKISPSVQTKQEPVTTSIKKRNLPRRNNQQEIREMNDILEADAKEIIESENRYIDISSILDEKKTPR